MAWIYRNQTEWIISLSSDGTTWITIADKNLWATQVYNDGDTLGESNTWKYYQHWNNYWFPFSWTFTTSSSTVNASSYWPWNYYSSSTFITTATRENSINKDLWWWVTWTVVAMQWPCASWFHIPTKDERLSLSNIWVTLWCWTNAWLDYNTASSVSTLLKMPCWWELDYANWWTKYYSWTRWYYWTSERVWSSWNSANQLTINLNDGTFSPYSSQNISYWCLIRPFANTPTVPDRTWTKLYGDDIPAPTINRFIKNWNYFYFKDAPIHTSGVSLDKNSITLTTVWQTEQLTATIQPAWAIEQWVVWSSSDTSIATVDQTWLVTCVTPWECTITVTTVYGWYTASCSVVNERTPTSDVIAYFPLDSEYQLNSYDWSKVLNANNSSYSFSGNCIEFTNSCTLNYNSSTTTNTYTVFWYMYWWSAWRYWMSSTNSLSASSFYWRWLYRNWDTDLSINKKNWSSSSSTWYTITAWWHCIVMVAVVDVWESPLME